jgi:carbonic anhydrase/acetyltransferase-like protein (isoleucine patch superfamily)
VWFGAVVRADLLAITIGECSNVQDNAVIHITGSQPLDAVDSLGFAVGTRIGDHVTIGHSALVHGCTIGDRVLVGMGAIVLDGAIVGSDVLIGAGALIPPKMRVPDGVLVVGSPAKIVRDLRASERAWLLETSNHYVEYARRCRSELRAVG